MSLRYCLKEDFRLLTRCKGSLMAKLVMACSNRGMHAVLLYRVSHALWKGRVPVIPDILTRIAQILCSIDIAYEAEIGPGLVIVHGFGVVIGNRSVIEGRCCIFHGVTLGNRGSEWVGSCETDGMPQVGAGCILSAGAKLLGPIRIGANTVIGANAVVLKDVPDNSIAVGIPARVVGKRPLMDENLKVIQEVHDIQAQEREA